MNIKQFSNHISHIFYSEDIIKFQCLKRGSETKRFWLAPGESPEEIFNTLTIWNEKGYDICVVPNNHIEVKSNDPWVKSGDDNVKDCNCLSPSRSFIGIGAPKVA